MKFIIPIEPKAQQRVRFARGGRTYKAKGQKLAEEAIMAFLSQHQPDTPLAGPLLLGVKAFLPIPRSKPQKFKKAALAGAIRPTVKPDMDNLLKNVMDCMTSMDFWEDDKQVVEYLPGTGKYYSAKPRWELELIPFAGSAHDLKAECYHCIHRAEVPGSTHTRCMNPDPTMTGEDHGIKRGWFDYPNSFDPVWKARKCNNFEPRQEMNR